MMPPELATYLLLLLTQVAPPGVPLYKPHSEHKSFEACIAEARKLMHQHPACVPLPWIPV